MQSSSIEILAKLNYAHTPMKIEADKEIMIASLRLYCHSMQKLSTHQDKFQFVTPWNCNWKLSLLLWKSWMEIFPTLLRAQIKIKVWRDLLRKTQSSDFRWSSKVLVLWNFFSLVLTHTSKQFILATELYYVISLWHQTPTQGRGAWHKKMVTVLKRRS